jgi:hypothetical protein
VWDGCGSPRPKGAEWCQLSCVWTHSRMGLKSGEVELVNGRFLKLVRLPVGPCGGLLALTEAGGCVAASHHDKGLPTGTWRLLLADG